MAGGTIRGSLDTSSASFASNDAFADTEPARPAVTLRTSEQTVHAPPVELPVLETVEHCVSKLDAVALALLGSGSSAARVLGAFKAGLDLAECSVKEQEAAQTAANHRAAIDQCIAHEGTPLGFVGEVLTCAVPPGKAP